MNSGFFTSKILQTDFQQNQLQEICSWLRSTHNLTVDPKSILNNSNIILINTENESIKIKTVRELKEKLSYAGYNAKETQFVILLSAENLTHPAQNALLKTIEEPPQNTQILLITPTPSKLLQTIQSRCQKISLAVSKNEHKDTEDTELATAIETLISDNIAKKIEFAQNYKKRDVALLFCNRLILYLHKQLKTTRDAKKKKRMRELAKQLVIATQRLEQNTNVRLTLEVAFTQFE